MMRWTDLRWTALLAILWALIALTACGQDLVFEGMPLLVTPTPTETGCLSSGAACTLDSDCCSGSCISPDGVNLECE